MRGKEEGHHRLANVPSLQHLTVPAAHADPFTGGSYGGDDMRGTEEGHHRLPFWDEQEVVLEGDTLLFFRCHSQADANGDTALFFL